MAEAAAVAAAAALSCSGDGDGDGEDIDDGADDNASLGLPGVGVADGGSVAVSTRISWRIFKELRFESGGVGTCFRRGFPRLVKPRVGKYVTPRALGHGLVVYTCGGQTEMRQSSSDQQMAALTPQYVPPHRALTRERAGSRYDRVSKVRATA